MAPERGETALARDLREGRFVVSVQIDPPLGGDYTGLLETVEAIRESGSAGYVDINDNATASAKLSAMIMAAAIERRLGVETIPHLTSRDYSVMGLEALLLGGHAEGVRNILAVTGDPPEVGDYPGSKGIYEVDAIGLTQLIAHLNAGQSYNGKPIDAPTSFFIGVAVNPTADDLELEADRFRRKVDAGAQFAMTQILFDLRYLEDFRERIGGTWPIPVLVGIFPLSTYRLALRLHNEVPGIVVPEALQAELRDAGPAAAAIGTAHARKLVRELREKVDGIYVATPFRRPLAALDVLLDN
jgi:homocysteine S-methyltransferase